VFDGVSIFYGSKILLLFSDFGQIGVPFGGKEKRIWWVYFVGILLP
jgi:hypothetical protein